MASKKVKRPAKKNTAHAANSLGRDYTTEELIDAVAIAAEREEYEVDEVIGLVARVLG
jgi:hypothetical protein